MGLFSRNNDANDHYHRTQQALDDYRDTADVYPGAPETEEYNRLNNAAHDALNEASWWVRFTN